MKRGALNFIVDVISFTDLLCLAVTGFIIKYILPPGTGGHGRGFRGGQGPVEEIKYPWSMTRHEWGYIHFYLAVGFVNLMVVAYHSALDMDKKLFRIAARFFTKNDEPVARRFFAQINKVEK